MKYDDYSKKAFEKLSISERSKKLVELDKQITEELREVVSSRMEDIVKGLNEQGHALKRNKEIENIGETDFCESHNKESCGFRVGSDITISSGYFGASDYENEAE